MGNEKVILTCVYCGKSPVLSEHIKICESHPLRKAEADILKLRSALIGLIGVETKEGLKRLEATMRVMSTMPTAPKKDVENAINAIHVLLDTSEE